MEKRELLIARYEALTEIVAKRPAMKKRRGPLSPKKRAWKIFKKKWFARKFVKNPFTKAKVSLSSFPIERDPSTNTERRKQKAIRDRLAKARSRKADTPAQMKAKNHAIDKAQAAIKMYKKELAWFNKQVPKFQESKNAARRAFNEEWAKKKGGGEESKKAASTEEWADAVLSDLLDE